MRRKFGNSGEKVERAARAWAFLERTLAVRFGLVVRVGDFAEHQQDSEQRSKAE